MRRILIYILGNNLILIIIHNRNAQYFFFRKSFYISTLSGSVLKSFSWTFHPQLLNLMLRGYPSVFCTLKIILPYWNSLHNTAWYQLHNSQLENSEGICCPSFNIIQRISTAGASKKWMVEDTKKTQRVTPATDWKPCEPPAASLCVCVTAHIS